MRMLVGLLCIGLLGCASHAPHVAVAPMPDDISWVTPSAVEMIEPLPPRLMRPATPHEKVYAFEPGMDYKVDVPVGSTLDLTLQPGEQVLHIGHGDRRPLEPGEEQPPWDVKQGMSTEPHVILTVTKSGLSMGLTIMTSKRVYTLTCRSVGVSKVRVVRWSYPSEPRRLDANDAILPDNSVPQSYHIGYTIEASDPRPVWTPRHTLDSGRQTFIILPSNVAAMDSPMVRLVGALGPELVNVKQYGSILIISGLFNQAELRVGTGPTAEVVKISRGMPVTISCPGHPACPVWPDVRRAADRAHRVE